MNLEEYVLPPNWKVECFGKLVNFKIGKTPPRNHGEYWVNGIYPWVSIADMQPFRTIINTKEKVSEEAHKLVFHENLVTPDSLLMSFKLTIGRVAKLSIPAYHNEAIISFNPDSKTVDPDFLMYYLAQINYLNYQDTAVKGKTLNKSKIERLEIALPPLSEQQKIAMVLSTVQRAIEEQERLLQLTKELKKSLLHILFTEGLCGEPQKMTEIGLVPESWDICKLGDLLQIKHGYAFDGIYFRESGHYILLTPGHFFEAGGFRDQGEKTKYYIADFPADYLLKKHDLLVVMTEQKEGLLGSSVFVPESNRYLHNQRLGLIQELDETRLRKEFLYHLFNTPGIRKRISMTASGSKVRHTSPNKIRDVQVALSSLEEQRQSVEILDMVDNKLGLTKRKQAALADLFHTLLHQLMTAQIRVHNLDLPKLKGTIKEEMRL